MSNIDERVVKMTFENGQFKNGVKDSIKAMDDLKKGMNTDGMKKGLADLTTAGRNFSLQGIAEGIEGIASRFSFMGIAGVTALVNIANQAYQTGVQMIKSLTIDPIKAGLDEYELKMGSIQTILANTSRYGTKLEDVTKALDDLNTYADKTIYNFGDMTKNIGLFTNAGIRIEDATSMIKGFSNAAAASGTNAQGAASAAYQLSQALSAGTIRLMDWRSLQNVGMGNKNMQNGLIEIADAMGMFNSKTTDAQTASENFNGSLEKGWLSADVMSSYLKIMAGDMDYAEMKALGLSDAVIKNFQDQQKTAEEAATKVRTWTQLVGTMREAVGSSWSETFGIIIGDFNEATDLWTGVNNVMSEMIGESGDARNKLLQEWKDLGGRDAAIMAVKNAFGALMSVLKPIKEAFREIFPPATAKQLVTLTENIRTFFYNLKIGEDTADNLKRIFKGLFAFFDIGIMIIKGLLGVFGDLFGKATEGSGGFLDFAAKVGDFIVKVRDALKNGEGLSQFFDKLGDILQKPIDAIRTFLGWIGELISKLGFFDGDNVADGVTKIGDSLTPIQRVGAAIVKIFKKIGQFLGWVGDIAKDVGSWLADMWDKIVDGASNINWGIVLGAISVGLLGGIIKMFKNFSGSGVFGMLFGDLGTGLVGQIKGIFGALTDTLKALQTQIKSKALMNIAIALALLTASVIALSFVDPKDLAGALGALTVMFADLAGFMIVFDRAVNTGSLAKLGLVSIGLILLSTAILILTAAVKKLSGIDWNGLAKGLLGVAALLGMVIGLMYALPTKNIPKLIGLGIGLIVFATGIRVLVESVEALSKLDWGSLAKGLLGVMALLGMVIGLAYALPASAAVKIAGVGVGLVILALALKMMAGVVTVFAGFDVGTFIKGVGAISVLLGVIAIFSRITGNGLNILATAVGIVVLAQGLKMLTGSISVFASMSWEELGKGAAGLAGALLIIAGAMQLMPKDLLLSAAGLVVVAVALQMLARTFESFAGMSWEDFGKSMAFLAGGLLIIAGAMYLMSGALPGAAALLVVAAALAIIAPVLALLGSLPIATIAIGLGALAALFIILGVAGYALAPVIPVIFLLGAAVALLGAGLALAGAGVFLFATGLATLAAVGAVGAAALVLIVKGLLGLIPYALEQFALGIQAFAAIIGESGPQFVAAMTTLIMSLLETINNVAPAVVETMLNLIWMLVNAVVTNVPKFVVAGLKLITGVLNGIANNIGKVIAAGANLIVKFLEGIGKNIPKVLDAAAQLIIDFLRGVADTIRKRSAEIQAAGWDIAKAIIEGMVNGLKNGMGAVWNAAKNIASSALDGIKGFLGINSPAKATIEAGKWTAEGMAVGLKENADQVYAAAKGVGESAKNGLKKSIADINKGLTTDINLNPTIKPVLDLSAVKKDATGLTDILASPSIKVGTTADNATAAYSGYERNKEERMKMEDEALAEKMGDTTIYNQNNYSPKALSEAEIYRQTKNQLSQTKGGLQV